MCVFHRITLSNIYTSYSHKIHLIISNSIRIEECFISYLKHDRIPHVFAERGWRADWQHNRTGLVLRILTRVALISAAVAFLLTRRADTHQGE